MVSVRDKKGGYYLNFWKNVKKSMLQDNARPQTNCMVQYKIKAVECWWQESASFMRTCVRILLMQRMSPCDAWTPSWTLFGWNVLSHPCLSPDLARSDYHLFTKLKENLDGKYFSNDDKMKIEMKNSLIKAERDFYDTGIKKLVLKMTKCIEQNGDYAEK